MSHLLLGFSAVNHQAGVTQVRGARVYSAHPAHDGIYVCSVDFDLFVNEGGDFEFLHLYSIVDKGLCGVKGITKVDPYFINKALEAVIESLGSGEILRLESGTIVSEDCVEGL